MIFGGVFSALGYVSLLQPLVPALRYEVFCLRRLSWVSRRLSVSSPRLAVSTQAALLPALSSFCESVY